MVLITKHYRKWHHDMIPTNGVISAILLSVRSAILHWEWLKTIDVDDVNLTPIPDLGFPLFFTGQDDVNLFKSDSVYNIMWQNSTAARRESSGKSGQETWNRPISHRARWPSFYIFPGHEGAWSPWPLPPGSATVVKAPLHREKHLRLHPSLVSVGDAETDAKCERTLELSTRSF